MLLGKAAAAQLAHSLFGCGSLLLQCLLDVQGELKQEILQW